MVHFSLTHIIIIQKLKSEYDQFGKELDMLNKDMFKYQPSLKNEFKNLSIRLKQDQDVLTAAEHCRAPAEQFEHFMPGRLYCFAAGQVVIDFVSYYLKLCKTVGILCALAGC